MNRDPRHGNRQTGQQQADTGDVHALLGFRHGATDDHVTNQRWINTRHLGNHGANHFGQHVVRPYIFEHAVTLGDRQTGRSNDVGVLNLFAHDIFPWPD